MFSEYFAAFLIIVGAGTLAAQGLKIWSRFCGMDYLWPSWRDNR